MDNIAVVNTVIEVEVYTNEPRFDELLFKSKIVISRTANEVSIVFDRDQFVEEFKYTVSNKEKITLEYWVNGTFLKFHDIDFFCDAIQCPFKPYPNVMCLDCWAESIADNLL